MTQWHTSKQSVLVADDDLDLLSLLGFALGTSGFDVSSTCSGNDAIREFTKHQHSVLILDKEMPDLDGIEVCTRIREQSNVPILMLSGRKQEEEVLQALEAGADGYITKPFSPRTLVAHVRALLRRTAIEAGTLLSVDQFRLDLATNTLFSDAGELRLTKIETRVMQTLIRNAGESVSSDDLLNLVWGRGGATNRKMLGQIVFRLRRKLATAPQTANVIVTTERGYLWDGKLLEIMGFSRAISKQA